MAFLVAVTILGLMSTYGVSSSKLPRADSDVGLNTVEMIQNHGYVCENHYITTEDGYILTYQRIPHGINDDEPVKRPAVLLMHGLLSSSVDYVNMGPDRSLGYILADTGYDVWLGNARGNAWSRNHTTLDVQTDSEQFFDFSWHEIGYYDLPASIDYILNLNGDDSLHYVGHSQGTTAFFVLASTKPEYNDKIKVGSLMGPASIMEHHHDLLQVLSKYIDQIDLLLKKYKIFEIPALDLFREVAAGLCITPENFRTCLEIIALVDGPDYEEYDISLFGVILSNTPSNAAVKQFIHYAQQIKNGGFSQYDYGTEKNMELYGTEKPPAYDISKISAPVAMYYGKNDGIVNYMDAITVVGMLPNVADDYLVPYDLFDHLDFLFAIDVVEMVYNELIDVMQKY